MTPRRLQATTSSYNDAPVKRAHTVHPSFTSSTMYVDLYLWLTQSKPMKTHVSILQHNTDPNATNDARKLISGKPLQQSSMKQATYDVKF